MDKKYLLGVDVGTTSIKVVVIDENAKPLGISSSSYRLITPDQNSVQIDMEDMWNAYLKCIRLLQEGKKLDLSKVAGISISSLCPGLVAMGREWRGSGRCDYLFRRRSTGGGRDDPGCGWKGQIVRTYANTAMAGSNVRNTMLWSNASLPEQYEKQKYFWPH